MFISRPSARNPASGDEGDASFDHPERNGVERPYSYNAAIPCTLRVMRNPTRRNRNIGTAKSGHGQNNRLTIPRPHHGGNVYWERIEKATKVKREVSGQTVHFFVQPTLADYVHACTIDDIVHLLSHVPPADWETLCAIVLRQPRRKEETLSPVWGRLAYAADLVNAHGTLLYQGPAIVLEAHHPTGAWEFGRNLDPDDLKELERLQRDGHRLRTEHGKHIFENTVESCRTTQLHRTLLHEIGHWVDYLEKVERPADSGLDWEQLNDRYHQRPSREKEDFAHRYADQMAKELSDFGVIPFARVLDSESLSRDGLQLSDFLPSET
ncbi:hypothetical protein Acid345_3569 [Candidatus Koribacter versatilis Ellin345]|uniref:Uncharacterized protein n=1 Tax=Koribacter versatilis (strain Ellin345) TaxID=204669 RepID=Q1IKN0_KORVE|nr:hypothetical protein Acid345_3569 [Candidatus Koribacter versatilis Ellin345]